MDEVKQLIQRNQTEKESKIQKEANFIIALCKDIAIGVTCFPIAHYAGEHNVEPARASEIMREVFRIKNFNALRHNDNEFIKAIK